MIVFKPCCNKPHVDVIDIEVKPWYIRWFGCWHSWAVAEPLDESLICTKCGARRVPEPI